MTDDARLPADHPTRVLAELELTAAASSRCPLCGCRGNIISAAGPIPFVVEHTHMPDCPAHDDNQPAVEA